MVGGIILYFIKSHHWYLAYGSLCRHTASNPITAETHTSSAGPPSYKLCRSTIKWLSFPKKNIEAAQLIMQRDELRKRKKAFLHLRCQLRMGMPGGTKDLKYHRDWRLHFSKNPFKTRFRRWIRIKRMATFSNFQGLKIWTSHILVVGCLHGPDVVGS